MFRHLISLCVLLGLFSCGVVHAQGSPPELPEEDVIDGWMTKNSSCESLL